MPSARTRAPAPRRAAPRRCRDHLRRRRGGRGLAVFCAERARRSPAAVSRAPRSARRGRRERGRRQAGHRRARPGGAQFRRRQAGRRRRGVPLAQDLRNVQGMRVELVRRILDTAQALMDELAQAAPDDLQLQRSRSAMFASSSTTYLAVGRSDARAAAAEESLAIMRKLAAADPGNAGWQRDLSVSLTRSATCGWRRATGRGRWRPTRRASRSGASSPPSIRAMPDGSAT